MEHEKNLIGSLISMALQDLCKIQDLYLDKNTSECSLEPFLEKTECNYVSSLPFSHSRGVFRFYIPAAEFLDKNPIEFGQRSSIHHSNTVTSPESVTPFLSPPTSFPPASLQSVALPFPMSHGTTTLAFTFQGGVLAAADTRSSCSGLVACPSSQKILPIHSHLVGTTSGTSADCVLSKRILARELRLYQLRYGHRLSTSGAAKLLSYMLHPFKGTDLCVAATLCGWDGGEVDGGENTDLCSHTVTTESQITDLKAAVDSSIEKGSHSSSSATSAHHRFVKQKASFCGPSLHYVCSDGTRLKGTLFSVGSGSPYAYSILDQRVRWELTVDEATLVAREAVYRATHRDAYSGNCVDVYYVSSKGWIRRRREDLKEEYYREKERCERRRK